MRLILAFEHVRRFVGAHAQVVTELAQRLGRRGHEVTIICDTVTDPALYPDLHFIARRPFHVGGSHRPAMLHFWARRVLASRPHDLVLSFHPAIAGEVMVPMFGFDFGPDRVRRGGWRSLAQWFDPRRMESRWIGRRSRRDGRVRCVAALSEGMRESLLDAAPEIEGLLRLVPGASPIEPPAEDAARRALGEQTRAILRLEPTDIVFLWAAKAPHQKGGAAVLRAFAEVAALGHPSARLIMACEDPWPMHDLAVDLDCDERVRLVSRTREMERLLAAADIGVMPAQRSLLGRFVWECLAFGVPVIANTKTAGTERVRDPQERVAGRIISSTRPEALREAMIGLLNAAHLDAARRSAQAIAPSMRFDLFVDRIEALAREFARRR
ncbi:MAG: glycosyltransferase family 4 protein [Phycisphaerales bacterium]|nr:glycosyltransferase family 4 protein [Phycisphaerales bacterium]